jgi:SAM-dependent methyltransferase
MPTETQASHPRRSCPICLGGESKLLFHQTFATLSESSLMDGYDVRSCKTCGGCFADAIPPQATFDRYYAEMSKYAHGDTGGKISQVDVERFQQVVDSVSPYVKSHESIVDVGCATGYHNLTGFDPSPDCAATARRLYDIEVRPVTINGLDQVTERFDVMLLTGVFEHLCDLESSLILLKRLIKPNGRLYLEVPDASTYYKWYSAPFQFFSMEHVNFFSPKSLPNLLGRHGFACSFANRVKRFLGPKAVEPAVSALFSHMGMPTPIVYDNETEPGVRKYLDLSRSLEAHIHGVIDQLVRDRTPLVVWGVGTHTLRLLKTSSLAKANLISFLDSNSAYQGKTLGGIPIESPDTFNARDLTILISSHVAEQEIKNHIQNKLGWPNKLVCLYESAPTEL